MNAIELRQAGLSKRILILGVSEIEAVSLAKEYDITLTVAGLEWIQALLSSEEDLAGLTVHLKIDSGMGRIGFREASEAEQAQNLLQQHGARVEGIFTHFATADEESDDYFNAQLERFKTILASMKGLPELVHASNSATTLWHADTIFNAVRLGDAMYGLNPSGEVLDLPYDLTPALTLESALVHVKTVPSGACMGYGATYQADSEQVIATVPIGYADGWTRDMQNFAVLVDGQACQSLGEYLWIKSPFVCLSFIRWEQGDLDWFQRGQGNYSYSGSDLTVEPLTTRWFVFSATAFRENIIRKERSGA